MSNRNKVIVMILVCFTMMIFNGIILYKRYNNIKELKKVSSISVDEAYYIFRMRRAVFIDARPVGFFKSEHIPNAISLPYSEHIRNSAVSIIPKDSLLITYCDHSGCNLSYLLSVYLKKKGF